MYTEYWQLNEKPFENTPDPKFIYNSWQQKEALARLLYVVREHKGAAFISGEYGSGKTLLSRVLCKELQQENRYQSVFVLNPRLSGLEFIQEIVHQLGSPETPDNKIELFHRLHNMLNANHNAGRHSVIVIDEAQAIYDQDIFEELRLLLNFQLDDAFLLTIVLIGQPELLGVISALPQLSQRMAIRYHLKPLDEKESREYIEHRLEVAQAKRQIFTEEAYKEIFMYSGGTPRCINNICDLALLVGYGSGLVMIDKKTITNIGEDMKVFSKPGDIINPAYTQGVQSQPGTVQSESASDSDKVTA